MQGIIRGEKTISKISIESISMKDRFIAQSMEVDSSNDPFIPESYAFNFHIFIFVLTHYEQRDLEQV